jgi:hypothetical protein
MDNLSAWSITADHPHFALLPGEVFAISKGKAAFAKIAFDHSNEQIRPLKPISALN